MWSVGLICVDMWSIGLDGVTRTWAPIANKTQTFDAISSTISSSESWPGSFIAGTAPYFTIKRCANPASNWALFINVRQQTHLRNSVAVLEKKIIHSSRNDGIFGKLNKVIFPSQPKTHFCRDIFPERSCSRSGLCVHRRILLGEMPI